MTIYHKAIKVRKECESHFLCTECTYKEQCLNSNILLLEPRLADLKEIVKAIVLEKWNIK